MWISAGYRQLVNLEERRAMVTAAGTVEQLRWDDRRTERDVGGHLTGRDCVSSVCKQHREGGSTVSGTCPGGPSVGLLTMFY